MCMCTYVYVCVCVCGNDTIFLSRELTHDESVETFVLDRPRGTQPTPEISNLIQHRNDNEFQGVPSHG